jgi:hypothetical protein
MEAKILNNNMELLSGDEVSIKMIFNNISGKNFKNKIEHQIYLNDSAIKGLKSGTIRIESLTQNETINIEI